MVRRSALAARARNALAALLVASALASGLAGCGGGGATSGPNPSISDGRSPGARSASGELSCAQISELPSFAALPDLRTTTKKAPPTVPLPSGTFLASCAGRWTTPPTDPVLVFAYRGITADTYGQVLLAAGWTNGGSTEPSGGGPGTWDSAKVADYELDVSIPGPYLLVVVDNINGPTGPTA